MNSEEPQKRLLAVFAHPDDESFGIGGTLARYAREGVDVHVLIMTDGAVGTVDPELLAGYGSLAELRAEELRQASEVLGVTLHQWRYRDSGMLGAETNNHPDCLIQADRERVVGRVVELMRRLRPQVVITHDPAGGYFHPDHIAVHDIVTQAFQAAGAPGRYPEQVEAGLVPYRPHKLYYTALPRTWIRWLVRIMRLLRRDPTHFGRNGDIDLTRLGTPDDQIHTRIDVSDYLGVKAAAATAHRSQGGGPGFQRGLPRFVIQRLFGREMFVRAYPKMEANISLETDLFAGVVPEETA